jgi:hypothetical protein
VTFYAATLQWLGTGSITPNNSSYTFGLKFNLADAPGWKDYDMTTSYEAYIVTHTNKTSKEGRFIGTVYPPGDPVGYDCYVNTATWRTPSFIQLYAFRRANTWSGPVNVQAILKFWEDKGGTSFKTSTWYMSTGMSIGSETFDTAGTFRLDKIQIPALNTVIPMPTNVLSNPSFDAENYDTQTPSGWSEWEGNASNTSIPATSSYTESYGGAANGARHGTHYKNAAYRVYTYQVKTGLTNGLYTLRAYARRGGNQSTSIWRRRIIVLLPR